MALLRGVRAAGGWAAYVGVPRLELLALRRALPALRESGRASPSSVPAHERLFLRADVPDDVFSHILTFWRTSRDYSAARAPPVSRYASEDEDHDSPLHVLDSSDVDEAP